MCVCARGSVCVRVGRPLAPPSLQVLENASVAEVVDVSAEVHHLWVDVGGQAAVGGGGTV